MHPSDFKERLTDALHGDKGYGFSVFCCVRTCDSLELRRFRIRDDFRDEVRRDIIRAVSSSYLCDNAIYEKAENIADNTNALYLIESNDQYCPLAFLEINTDSISAFSESERTNLMGFAFRFSLDSKTVWAYQHIYSTSISKRAKGFFALLTDDNLFEKLENKKLFCIESRVDAIYIDGDICPVKISFLEKNFGFETYIRSEAQFAVDAIEKTGLISDMGKFTEFVCKEKLTNAKKMLKMKNSPVLSMSPETIIERLSIIPQYREIKVENGKIIADSQKDVVVILKMLNDDILRSELTSQEYDSPVKNMLSQAT